MRRRRRCGGSFYSRGRSSGMHHGVGGQLLPLFGRKLLIFLPLLPDCLALLRGQLAQGLELLSRDSPLVRRQPGPCTHLILYPLLLRRWHRRIPLGDG